MFDVLAVLFLLAFFVGFPLVWIAVVKMIGKAGWAPLAEAYPAREWPDASYRVPRQSALIGASSYGGTLNAAATPEGYTSGRRFSSEAATRRSSCHGRRSETRSRHLERARASRLKAAPASCWAARSQTP